MQELTERKSTRIEIIDVLRGFTLLGIALVHFTEQYYAGQPPKAHENFTNHIVTDPIISGIIGIFISGKFYMIFSFLFGLSFFIQLSKNEKQTSFLVRFTWRLAILFAIGFVHNLFYRGDILTIYAVLGLGLLICFKLPDKILLIIALLLVINLPSIGTRAVQAVSPQSEGLTFLNADQKSLEVYYETVKAGSFMDTVEANLHEFDDKKDFQVESGRLYITMGLFLLGLYAGRTRIFENIEFFKRLIRYSLWILLGDIIFTIAFFGGMHLAGREASQPVAWLVGGGAYDIFNACLSAIYVSIIIRLFQKDKWKKRLMIFYSVGRMGLTTYLTQTLTGVILFFGYGFGLLGEIGTTVCAALAIAVFILQTVFSNYWLRNFQYGPVEWLWRSLTYLRIQPLRRDPN